MFFFKFQLIIWFCDVTVMLLSRHSILSVLSGLRVTRTATA